MATDDESAARAGRRERAVVMAVIALAVAGLVAVPIFMQSTRTGPVEAVREYLQAIADGDATLANTLAPPPPQFHEGLVGDAALTGATSRITDIGIEPVEAENGTGTGVVDASYSLDGLRFPVQVHVEEDPDDPGSYRVSSPVLVAARLTTAPGTTVTVGGTSFVTMSRSEDLLVYPGVYPVLGQADPTIGWRETSLRGQDPASTEEVEPRPELTADGAARVDSLVVDAVRACLRTFGSTPECQVHGEPEGRGSLIWRVPDTLAYTLVSDVSTSWGSLERASVVAGIRVEGAVVEVSRDGTTFVPVQLDGSWGLSVVGGVPALIA